MKRDVLNVSGLQQQAALYGVEFCDGKVMVGTPLGGKGSGLLVTQDIYEDNSVLVEVPADLVLSPENVWVYAKADKHLTEVLEAMGESSRVRITDAGTAKGAIRLFLLLQVTHGATNGQIGVSSFFSHYVKHLPKDFSLPTFWDDNEGRLLEGTTLEAATKTKLKSLDREFTLLKEKTVNIDWCQKYWWSTETGSLSFEDWKIVDAMYRSRAMDLPGTGFATVPVMDMANHAVGVYACARYETNSEANAVLLLRDNVKLRAGEEITISYGDDNGASEMLHSYGFIEQEMSSAKQLWLDLDIPDDDPLGPAKRHAANSAPGFKLFQNVHDQPLGHPDSASEETTNTVPVDWESPYAWLINVNEEDGLEFKLLRTIDEETDMQTSWKGTVVTDLSNFQDMLSREPLYDVFKLRVVTMLRDRLWDQLMRLEQSKANLPEIVEIAGGKSTNYSNAIKLRDLEESLMLRAYDNFGSQQTQLVESEVVQEYLRTMTEGAQGDTLPDDDFA